MTDGSAAPPSGGEPDGSGLPADGAPTHPRPFPAPPAGPGPVPFRPPPGSPLGPPVAWLPPEPAAVLASPPAGRPPRPPRRPRSGRTALVAVIVAAGLLSLGILSALPLLPRASGPAPSSTAAPVVVTAAPSTAAGADRVLAGGDLGRTVGFTGRDGSGTITVTSATWTDTGAAPPTQDRRYLVLEVVVTCTGGSLPVDPLLLLAASGDQTRVPGFGPDLAQPLAGQLLAAGARVQGQVGYELEPGPVQVHLLDEQLLRLATVELPAP